MKKKNLLKTIALCLTFSILFVGCGSAPSVEEVIESNIDAISSEISTIDKTDKDSTIDVDTKTTETDKSTEVENVKSTSAPDSKATAKPGATTKPKATAKPSTSKATAVPTAKPTTKPSSGSNTGSGSGNSNPVATAKPTAAPTAKPTAKPTAAPTQKPSISDDVANGDSIGNGGLDGSVTGCSHEFVDLGQYMWAPTCAATGSGKGQCKKCGTTTSITIPATGQHNFVFEKEFGEANCSSYKDVQYMCTGCGTRKTEKVNAPGTHVGTNSNGDCRGCGKHLVDVAPPTNTAPSEPTVPENTTPDTTPNEPAGDAGSGDTSVIE